MYIYGAQMQARPGKGAAAAAKVAEIRDVVKAETGQIGWAWVAVAGTPVGGYLLSTRVEGMAALIELQMKLAQSEAYKSAAAGGADLWTGPAETNLGQVVATTGEIGDPKPVLSVTRATIAGGHMAEALAHAGKVLEHVTKVTGLSGMLATYVAGNPFEVTWIFGVESGAAADEATRALQADADYVALMDQGGGLYVDGTLQRAMLMQLP